MFWRVGSRGVAMLTRLQVDGFKNLRQVDLRFGPLTCIAGRNGVGKSNLFDAIALLSDLASMPLVQAATRVRGTGGRLSGIGQLFGRDGDAQPCIRITAEMIVPRQVHDDFDRAAEATATCLRYTVALTLRQQAGAPEGPTLHLLQEDLVALSLEAATQSFKFQPGKAWLAKYLKGPRNRTGPFIATLPGGAIKLLGDTGGRGRPFVVPADKSPQTVLAGVNASTHPTVLAARREMQSWRLLQLEPTALRAPDEFSGENRLSATGGHLPNTLKRVACHAERAWVTFKPSAGTGRSDGLTRTAVVSKGMLTAYLGDDPVRLPRPSAKRTVQDHLTGDLFQA